MALDVRERTLELWCPWSPGRPWGPDEPGDWLDCEPEPRSLGDLTAVVDQQVRRHETEMETVLGQLLVELKTMGE